MLLRGYNSNCSVFYIALHKHHYHYHHYKLANCCNGSFYAALSTSNVCWLLWLAKYNDDNMFIYQFSILMAKQSSMTYAR